MVDDLTLLIGRHVFALGLILSWMNSAIHTVTPRAQPYTRGLSWPRLRGSGLLPLGLSTLIFLTLAEAFALGWTLEWTGLGLLTMIAGIRHFEVRTWADNRVLELGKYAPTGVALFGYQVGYWLTWSHETSYREAVGWEVAAGMLAAAWFLTGWHKVRLAGKDWFSQRAVVLLIAERVHRSKGRIRALRLRLLRSPKACQVAGGAGVIAELACALYVFPSMRIPITVVVEGLLLSVFLFLGYFELEWMLVMIAVTMVST